MQSTAKAINPKTGKYYKNFRLPGDKRGVMPEEVRLKIVKARTGLRHSKSTRKKISLSHVGKTLSKEVRAKISETMKKHWISKTQSAASSGR